MSRPASSLDISYDYRRVLLADVNNLLDEEGRPIGEIRASKIVRKAVRSEYQICPYSGSRNRKPHLMNTSALGQITSHWPNVLGLLSYVRSACIPEATSHPRLIELARVSAVMLTVPAYLLANERGSLSSKPIPAFVAGAHKMSAGLFGLCKNRLVSRAAMGEDHLQVTESVASLYRYAEESGALLSRTGLEACAGPPRLMLEALRVLVEGKSREETFGSDIRDTIRCMASLLKYANAVIDMTLWMNVFALCCHETMENLHSFLEAARTGFEPEFVTRACTMLTEYRQYGFSDPTLSALLQLPLAARSQYAAGAASLLRYVGPEQVNAMLGNDEHNDLEKCTFWRAFPATSSVENLPDAKAALGSIVFRVLVLEREGLRAFFDLQSMIHEALGWTPPSRSRVATILTSTFGALPGEYVKKVFDSGPSELRELLLQQFRPN